MREFAGVVEHLCLSPLKGTAKAQREGARFVENFGIDEDAHASADTHRQVSLLAEESISSLRGRGVEVAPGGFGENLRVSGVDVASLRIGDVLRVGGSVRLEITQIGKECHSPCSIYFRAGMCIMPSEGLFARVLSGGEVRRGDAVRPERLEPTP